MIILKQWKNCATIEGNLQRINRKFKCNFSDEDIYKVTNSRLGLYKRATGHVVNLLLDPKILAIKQPERPGLINSLAYYLKYFVLNTSITPYMRHVRTVQWAG